MAVQTWCGYLETVVGTVSCRRRPLSVTSDKSGRPDSAVTCPALSYKCDPVVYMSGGAVLYQQILAVAVRSVIAMSEQLFLFKTVLKKHELRLRPRWIDLA